MKSVLERKKEQLGVNPSTAYGRLKKAIMYDFAKRLDLDTCYRCGDRIELLSEFTVEHKEPWFDNIDPQGVFNDLDNIAFSHHACNVAGGRKNTVAFVAGSLRGIEKRKTSQREDGYIRCYRCKVWLHPEEFSNNSSHWTGKSSECRGCRSKNR